MLICFKVSPVTVSPPVKVFRRATIGEEISLAHTTSP